MSAAIDRLARLGMLVGAVTAALLTPAFAACQVYEKVRTTTTGAPTTMTLTNTGGVPAELFWIDDNAERHFYTTVAPGQTITQQSFVGHAWALLTEGGQCRQQFVASQATNFQFGIGPDVLNAKGQIAPEGVAAFAGTWQATQVEGPGPVGASIPVVLAALGSDRITGTFGTNTVTGTLQDMTFANVEFTFDGQKLSGLIVLDESTDNFGAVADLPNNARFRWEAVRAD